MIETDYANAALLIKRGDKVTQTFKFKEFVSAKDFKPVNDLKNKLMAIARGDIKVTEKKAGEMDIEFYELVVNTALTNPMSYEDATNIMTTPEIGSLAENVIIFLMTWSSTEAVKQFAKQLAEIEKKEPQP